jgi:DnaJ-class molecular chaperone
MYTTKADIADSTFGETRLRSQVKYSHTDPLEGDQWLITCPSCMGNGYDIDLEEVTMCSLCDGLGESSPVHELEVKDFFAGETSFPV